MCPRFKVNNMKRLLLLFIAFILLFGCSSKKKASETEKHYSKQAESSEVENVSTQLRVDTTKTLDIEINYTKVTFFDPDEGKPPDAIKQIESWTLKDKDTKRGVSDSAVNNTKQSKGSELIQEDISENNKEEPAPDPYKWRYIFYIIVSLIIVGIFLKRSTVFKYITSLFK